LKFKKLVLFALRRSDERSRAISERLTLSGPTRRLGKQGVRSFKHGLNLYKLFARHAGLASAQFSEACLLLGAHKGCRRENTKFKLRKKTQLQSSKDIYARIELKKLHKWRKSLAHRIFQGQEARAATKGFKTKEKKLVQRSTCAAWQCLALLGALRYVGLLPAMASVEESVGGAAAVHAVGADGPEAGVLVVGAVPPVAPPPPPQTPVAGSHTGSAPSTGSSEKKKQHRACAANWCRGSQDPSRVNLPLKRDARLKVVKSLLRGREFEAAAMQEPFSRITICTIHLPDGMTPEEFREQGCALVPNDDPVRRGLMSGANGMMSPPANGAAAVSMRDERRTERARRLEEQMQLQTAAEDEARLAAEDAARQMRREQKAAQQAEVAAKEREKALLQESRLQSSRNQREVSQKQLEEKRARALAVQSAAARLGDKTYFDQLFATNPELLRDALHLWHDKHARVLIPPTIRVQPEIWSVELLLAKDANTLENNKTFLFRQFTGLSALAFGRLLGVLNAAHFQEVVNISGESQTRLPRDRSWCDVVLFVLMFLRTNTDMHLLAPLFGFTARRGYGLVQRVTFVLATLMQTPGLIDLHAGNGLPGLKIFGEGPLVTVRHTVDCTEFDCQAAGNPGDQSRIWSDYKQRPTVKVLISINRRGDPNFVSDGYLGGTLSDHDAITKTGFLEQLQNVGGDVVTDKGFRHVRTNLRKIGISVIMPSFVSSKVNQLTNAQLTASQLISSARSHIERYNRRVKLFHVLSQRLPNRLLPRFNDILHTVVLATLFMPPLVAHTEPQPATTTSAAPAAAVSDLAEPDIGLHPQAVEMLASEAARISEQRAEADAAASGSVDSEADEEWDEVDWEEEEVVEVEEGDVEDEDDEWGEEGEEEEEEDEEDEDNGQDG